MCVCAWHTHILHTARCGEKKARAPRSVRINESLADYRQDSARDQLILLARRNGNTALAAGAHNDNLYKSIARWPHKPHKDFLHVMCVCLYVVHTYAPTNGRPRHRVDTSAYKELAAKCRRHFMVFRVQRARGQRLTTHRQRDRPTHRENITHIAGWYTQKQQLRIMQG